MMKKHLKILFSISVLAAYMLIGLATSQDIDSALDTGLTATVINPSDSCRVSDLKLLFTVNPTLEDTFFINEFVPALDTANLLVDSLSYTRMLYTCNCPIDTSYFQEIPVTIDATANALELILPTCD